MTKQLLKLKPEELNTKTFAQSRAGTKDRQFNYVTRLSHVLNQAADISDEADRKAAAECVKETQKKTKAMMNLSELSCTNLFII